MVKKLTVIGIIGNTQGVSSAANPLKNEIIKISHIDFLGSGTFLIGLVVSPLTFFPVSELEVSACFSARLSFSAANSYPLTLSEKGYSWGIKHFPASSQT